MPTIQEIIPAALSAEAEAARAWFVREQSTDCCRSERPDPARP